MQKAVHVRKYPTFPLQILHLHGYGCILKTFSYSTHLHMNMFICIPYFLDLNMIVKTILQRLFKFET